MNTHIKEVLGILEKGGFNVTHISHEEHRYSVSTRAKLQTHVQKDGATYDALDKVLMAGGWEIHDIWQSNLADGNIGVTIIKTA